LDEIRILPVRKYGSFSTGLLLLAHPVVRLLLTGGFQLIFYNIIVVCILATIIL